MRAGTDGKRSYREWGLSRAVDLMPDLIEGGEPVEVQAVCGRRLSAYRIGVYKKRYMLKYSQCVPIAHMRIAKKSKIAWIQKSEHRKSIMQSPLNINATSKKRATRGLCWAGWHFLRPAPIKPRYGRLFAIVGVIISRPLASGRGAWGRRLFRGRFRRKKPLGLRTQRALCQRDIAAFLPFWAANRAFRRSL